MSSSRTPPTLRWPLALALDVLAVLVFAAIGRASHERGLSLTGVVETAWPFLAALGAAWAVVLAWRAPAVPLRTGVPVALIAVVGGMLLRTAVGEGTALAFIVVAATTLLLLLVGWRGVARLIARARASGGRSARDLGR